MIKKNVLTADKVDIGYSTKHALKKVRDVPGIDVLRFKNDCLIIMRVFLLKITEKSPLKFPLVKGLSCFDPLTALETKDTKKLLSTVLDKFLNNNIISAVTAEKIDKQYKEITSLKSTRKKCESFRRNETRLDDFWTSIIKEQGEDNYKELLKFIKSVMILSHGNSALERGFAVNKERLVENQKEKSLLAQRLICDAIVSMDCTLVEFEISKKLIHDVRMSNSLYKEALEQEKKDRKKEEESKKNRKRKAIALKELENEKKRIQDNALRETEAIDKKKKALEKEYI